VLFRSLFFLYAEWVQVGYFEIFGELYIDSRTTVYFLYIASGGYPAEYFSERNR
jgi:hypothetical protein